MPQNNIFERCPLPLRHHGRVRRCWVALLLALLCFQPGARAESVATVPERWDSLTHTAFTHRPLSELEGATTFAQDRTGFLWIGTQSGLVRWDGYRTRRYTADVGRKGTLPDSFILALHVDTGGTLWVGTSAGGLARYDPGTDGFVTSPSGPAGTGNMRVAAIADDGAGGLWIGTGSGLARTSAGGAFSHLAKEKLSNGGVETLLRDRGGRLWIGTTAGLLRYDDGAAAPQAVALEPGAAKPLDINTLYQDSAGRIWIGTRNTGAFVIEAGASAPRAVRESGPTSTIGHERVISITEAGQGEVWLGTEGAGGGILAVNPQHGSTRRIRHQPDVPDGLNDNDISALYRDRSGLVFVSTMLGMSQHDPQLRAVTTVRAAGPAAGARLSIPSLMIHPNGRVWLAVAGGNVEIVDPQRGAVGRIKAGVETGAGTLPRGRVLSMASTPDGTVYIGTRLGLFRSNADGREVRRVDVPKRAANEPVYAMAYRDGVLWLGGLDGMWALSAPAGGALALLRHESASLGDPRVKALFPAPNGDVWIGTRSGLARLDSASGKVELLPTEAADPTRMTPGYLSSILMDRRGRMWFSSFGFGILMLERTDRDGRRWFKRVGKAEGLRDSSVNVLLEDRDGVIWASTDDGLARIDPDTFAVRLLGPAEGVHVNAYWTNAGARSAAGELLFGGLTGLTVLRPAEMRPWSYRAPLAVTKLVLNDKEVPGGTLKRALPDAIEIAPAGSERGFSLEFAALDFSAPERNLYSYRLAGFDPDWIQADAASRRISYNNLPPGNYALELRGSNRDGAWSPVEAIPVRVRPAWHQQSWVRMLALGALLGLMVALVQIRTAYLRRRQRELQDLIHERTAALEAARAQLEQLAYADPLTGLPNRRMFNDEMRHLFAQALRGGSDFTLLLIDLDHFKRINDTLGHDAGDALLIAAAARMKSSVRAVDRLFRLGGDEFAVLLNLTREADVIDAVCGRIVEAMAQPILYGDEAMRISASVGAAPFSMHMGGLEELYKTADAALYRSKARGRNTWTRHEQPVQA